MISVSCSVLLANPCLEFRVIRSKNRGNESDDIRTKCRATRQIPVAAIAIVDTNSCARLFHPAVVVYVVCWYVKGTR